MINEAFIIWHSEWRLKVRRLERGKTTISFIPWCGRSKTNKWTRNWDFHRTSKFTSPNYKFHGRYLWHWSCVPRHVYTVYTKAKDSRNSRSFIKRQILSRRKPSSKQFTSCHPPSLKNRFVKGGECLRILRPTSSEATSKENISNFKKHLLDRGYPRRLIEKILSGIRFTEGLQHLNRIKKWKKSCLQHDTNH